MRLVTHEGFLHKCRTLINFCEHFNLKMLTSNFWLHTSLSPLQLATTPQTLYVPVQCVLISEREVVSHVHVYSHSTQCKVPIIDHQPNNFGPHLNMSKVLAESDRIQGDCVVFRLLKRHKNIRTLYTFIYILTLRDIRTNIYIIHTHIHTHTHTQSYACIIIHTHTHYHGVRILNLNQ